MADKPGRNLFNFTLAGIEELEHFPSEEERQKALAEIGSSVKGWALVAGIMITAFSAAAANVAVKMALRWMAPGLHREVRDLIVIVATIGAFLLVLRWMHRQGVRQELRRKLNASGVRVCMGCGYLLRGLPEGTTRCPECGREIEAEAEETSEVGEQRSDE